MTTKQKAVQAVQKSRDYLNSVNRQKVKPVQPQNQVRPQTVKPQAVKQNQQNTYQPTSEQQFIRQMFREQEASQYKRQKELTDFYSRQAKESQLSNQRNQQKMQELVNLGNKQSTLISTEGVKYNADQQLKSSNYRADSDLKQADISANAQRYLADQQLKGSNYNADQQFRIAQEQSNANKYASDTDFNKTVYQMDAQREFEQEKNLVQREKNKQDLYLNTALGILDSINKQRDYSSRTAAAMYSAFLSNSPYNYRYRD